MKKIVLSLMFALLLLPSAVRADEKAAPETAQMPGMDAEMMAKMQAASTPNENHKILASLEGKWDHVVRWRMTPDDKFQESKGTNENKMIMGGRFLKQKSEGEWMGEKFEGLGITGYDNVKKEFNSIWIDTMGTGMMISNGQYDAAAKTIKEEGTFACPATGKTDTKVRSEWKFIDADNYVFEMYGTGIKGDLPEFKTMEVIYKRS